METVEKNHGQEEVLIEELEAMPREKLVERVKATLTADEIKRLTDKDFDLVTNLARRNIEIKRSQTVEDALIDAMITRAAVRETLGDAAFEVVQNERGEVIATGKDRVDALRKAQEMTGK
jgi:hypothetical protein